MGSRSRPDFVFLIVKLKEGCAKSAFLKGVGQFRSNFHVVGDVACEPFLHGCIGHKCLATPVADIIHTINFVAEFILSEVQFYTENGRFAFMSPFRGA